MFKTQKKLCYFTQKLFDTIETVDRINNVEIKGYNKRDVNEYILQCAEAGYISNVRTWRDANGNPHIDQIGKPYISISGYQFLNGLRSDIALEKSTKADIKGWIALVISILTFLVYFIENTNL